MKRSEMKCAKCIYWHKQECREDSPRAYTDVNILSSRFPEQVSRSCWCGQGLFEDDNGQLWAFHEGTTEESESFYASSRTLKIKLPTVGEDDD